MTSETEKRVRSTSARIREDGPIYSDGPVNTAISYRVEGAYRSEGRLSSKLFASTFSAEEAILDLDNRKSDPINSHITDWNILVFEPLTRITVLGE